MRLCTVCQQPVPPGMPVCPRDGAPADDGPAGDKLIGSMIGEYKLKGVIGEGGMGQVYEGIQPIIGKRVAIKLLRRELAGDPVEAQRLLSEARTVNAIAHRGIIDIFSFGALPDGRQYFVMEYLSGLSLSQHIRQHGALPVEDTLKLLEEMLSALGAAHAAGVIHRDLKPSNIFLVTQPDGTAYVKLLDFGIAKQAPYARGETPQTRVSRVMGTPEFMAPEQARGQPIGPRTDLYALGVLVFQMLTGELPFDADNPFEIVNKHLNEPPPAPSTLVPEVPPEVDSLVLWLMQKDVADRPASAEVVRDEVKQLRRSLKMNATQFILAPTSMTQTISPLPDGPGPAATPAPPAPAPPSKASAKRPRASNPNVETRLAHSPASPPGAASETRIVDRDAVKAPPSNVHVLADEVTEKPTAPPPAKSPLLPVVAGAGVLVVLAVVAGLVAWAPWKKAAPPEPVALVEPKPAEPEKAEPAKAEAEAVKAEPEPAKTEPAKTEPAKTEPVKTEPVRTEPVRTEPVRTEPVKAEPVKTEPVKTEPEKTVTPQPKADPLQARYKRVRGAWAKARASRSPEDCRIFDLMLSQVGKQLTAGARGDATETLNDFVQSALGGHEP